MSSPTSLKITLCCDVLNLKIKIGFLLYWPMLSNKNYNIIISLSDSDFSDVIMQSYWCSITIIIFNRKFVNM